MLTGSYLECFSSKKAIKVATWQAVHPKKKSLKHVILTIEKKKKSGEILRGLLWSFRADVVCEQSVFECDFKKFDYK
jgi:hypothetical protein